jgi:biopolymer transport protein ExbB
VLALALNVASHSVVSAQEAAAPANVAPAAKVAPVTPAAPVTPVAPVTSETPAATSPSSPVTPVATDSPATTPAATPTEPPPQQATPQASPASPGAQPAPTGIDAAHDVTPATNDPSSNDGHATSPVAATTSPSLVHAEKLPRDLSPWGMFMQADIVVKAVMIGLLLASVATWTVWLAKTIELWAAKHKLRHQLQKLYAANSLTEAANMVDSKRGAVPAMIRAAIAETRASWDVADKYAIKERITARLERVDLAAGRDINRGTGVLATIGSTAPFVGLFGTVWGIMNSFIGISEAQTTNLAIVAPGIAEALLATAFGLIAAIPAVIIYNHFARAIGSYKALVGDASVAVMALVSRDFDRGVRPELRAAE